MRMLKTPDGILKTKNVWMKIQHEVTDLVFGMNN